MDEDIIIYSTGLVHCSVCALAKLPIEDVLQHVNLRNPTGLDHGWVLDDKGIFADGAPNPCVCNTHIDRKHYLLSC